LVVWLAPKPRTSFGRETMYLYTLYIFIYIYLRIYIYIYPYYNIFIYIAHISDVPGCTRKQEYHYHWFDRFDLEIAAVHEGKSLLTVPLQTTI
jgi:hypothetical protein